MNEGSLKAQNLPQDRRRQLEALLRKKVEKSRRFPLSFAQQRLWILDRLDPGNPAYNIPLAIWLRGPLDLGALDRTLNEIVARHESLRTKIMIDGDHPVQVVESIKPYKLTVINLEHIEPDDRESEAVARAEAEARKPFRLDEAPLYRAAVLRFSPTQHVLVVVIHHIISDDWSMAVLFREVGLLYEAFRSGKPSPLEPLPIQYADYAVWQRQRVQGETLQQLLDCWRHCLANVAPLELPIDQPRTPQGQQTGDTEYLQLPRPLVDQLREVGRREGATLYMTLLAALQVLLYRYSAQEDFAIGSPIAGRTGKDTEGLVGFLVNTLVMRARVSGNVTFRDLLARVRHTALEAYQHQELPFEQLIDALNPERDGNRNPLFQVMFTLQNAPWPELSVAGISLSVIPLSTRASMFDLSFTMREEREGLSVLAEYSSSLFRTPTIQRMLSHLQTLLEGIVANVDQPVSQLPLLTAPQRQQLLVKWNDTSRDYRADLSAHEWFERRAKQTPLALALIDGLRQWTYEELDRRANQLAHYLQARGVGPDRLVAVRLVRSAELIVAILGVLKAGGAYLPLDPALPVERLQFTLEDAHAEVLVTQQSLRDDLPASLPHVISLDTDWDAIAQCPTELPTRSTTGNHLAYVIYTSGSTGRPKGVMIEHRALVNYLQAAVEQYAITAADRVLQFASASFDAHVEEIFPCLAQGATLVLRDDHMLDCRTFLQRCQQWQLTFVSLPTGFWHELTSAIAAERLSVPSSLRMVAIGGEQASPDRVATWFQWVGSRVKLLNTYGPTEATVVATAAELSRADGREKRVPIGRPLGNYRVYVLDNAGQPVPLGIPGELYIGGHSLARGYLHRAELTAERFPSDPFIQRPGARMYKTGDIVRWRDDGRLEFIGRTDHQVKIRGFRIEPGEVEQVLREHPQLADAAVVVRERGPGDLHLVAYVAARDGQLTTSAEMRQFLCQQLPDFMIPSAFVALPRLPMTPSGKVDRQALPRPDWGGDATASEGDFVAPRSPIEQQLASIWSELLHIDRVGVHDDFFNLGGNSLLALRLASLVRQAFAVDLPPIALFTSPTLGKLASEIVTLKASPSPLTAPSIVPVRRDEPLPASFAQEPFWFLQQLSPHSNDLNMHAALSISGQLHVDALRDTINEIIRRHESLRTKLALTESGHLVQVIVPQLQIDLPLEDVSHLPEADRTQYLAQLSQKQEETPFDLAQGPLVRIRLLRLDETEHVLLVTCHHIICDGWSLDVLNYEVRLIYDARREGKSSPLPELPIQYADYAVWQRNYLQGEMLESLLGYWRKKLHGLASFALPTDRPRLAAEEYRQVGLVFDIPHRIKNRLGRLCSEAGVTPFMVLLAAFQVLLHRYADSDDIAVGTLSANRRQPETQAMIGLFTNTLVMRSDLSGDPSFRALLAQVMQTAIEAYDHQEMRYDLLAKALQPGHDLTKQPLVQVWFVFHQFDTDQETEFSRDLDVTVRESNTAWESAEVFDLTLSVEDQPQGFRGQFEYDASLFDHQTIARMADHFQTLLEAVVANPDQRLSQLPLLTQQEREQVFVEWNQTEVDLSAPDCVHQLFEMQVQRTPDSVALVFEGQSMTYGQLNARANQLAHYLVSLGVGPEIPVGICLEPSFELAVAILATMKAGGVYLPLDPDDPPQRLDFFVADSQPAVVLTKTCWADRFSAPEARIVLLDAETDDIAQHSEVGTPCRVGPDDAVCLLYTSGSTGQPKAAVNLHRGIVNYLLAKEQLAGLGPDDRVLFTTPISFDTSVEEFFFGLTCGGCLVIEKAGGQKRDMRHLVELIARENITTACFVPSILRLLLEVEDLEGCRSLKRVFVGGEVLPLDLVERFFQRIGAELYNEYGPTEASIDVAVWKCQLDYPRGIIPIGRPIANVRLYILDEERNPVPIGVPGELYIGGVAVARGYHNRPELNAERFLPDPFSDAPHARMYRTGDRCRWLPDGNIEFLGRRDGQVKIHGGRLEVGEVESAIARHPEVAQAAVVVRQSSPDYKYLAAYVVPRARQIEEAEARTEFTKNLRQFLRSLLPEYMIPQAFEILDALPRLSSGKLNRAALPAVALAARPAHRYVVPRSPVEKQLAALWAEVLRVQRVGAHDNFFELGGHSLLAVRMISQVRNAFSIELPVATLFAAPTLDELAEQIEQLIAQGCSSELPPILAVPREGALPVSYGQEALWLIGQLEDGPSAYVASSAVRVRGPLSVPSLEQAVNELLRRHETLRTTFKEVEGRPVQVIQPYTPRSFTVVDLSGLPTEAREAESARYVEMHSQRPMNLSEGPLAQIELLRLSPQEHVVLTSMHHIIYDGWSMAVLYHELFMAYRAFAAGLPSPLPDLPIQYADFAVWQRERLQGTLLAELRQYWLKQLDCLPSLELPYDRPRPPLRTASGAACRCQLSSELSEQVARLSRQEQVTTFMTLAAVFQALLHRYSAQDDFPIGTPVAGRLRPETENLIGYFVNTLVLRANCAGDPRFSEFLARVRATALQAFDHQELPFELVVQDLNPPRDPGRHPVFQVMFVLHNTPLELQEVAELELSGLDDEIGRLAEDLDLVLVARESPEGIHLSLEYRTDLFDPPTIARMLNHFQTILEAVVADPHRPLSSLPMITDEERHTLLLQWSGTQADYPQDRCLHELFEEQVVLRPNAVAAVFEGQSLTYGQLNARANQLAHYLQSLGVGSEVFVGICLQRSLDMAVALLAVLKAGGAYVPLDPDYPPERLHFVVADSEPTVLLTTKDLVDRVPASSARVVCLDAKRDEISRQSEANLPCQTKPDNAIYAIYTSGSTGEPKGTVNLHRGLCNNLCWEMQFLRLDSADRVLFKTPLSFDVSVVEFFRGLLCGGRVVIAKPDVHRDPSYLVELICREGITTAEFVPSMLRAMLEDDRFRQCHSLKRVCSGAEILTPELVRSFFQQLKIPLYNIYGPTETSVGVAGWKCQPGDTVNSVPIGRPVSNVRLYILDGNLDPVPVGVPGELYVGGVAVGRGYLNHPELNAERFLPDPFAAPADGRLYKTGDRCRWLPDGNIEYLGRQDEQVKIRGFRIELGEVEAVLRQDPGVREAVVIARRDAAGDSRLAAYVVPQSTIEITRERLWSLLQQRLPQFMVPTSLALLDSLPLMPNGKVDRRALPEPDEERPELSTPYVAPRNETEQRLTEIWQDVLELNRVGIHDNFFALGGHSLLAVRMMVKVRAALNITLPVTTLFAAPTVAELAERIDAARRGDLDADRQDAPFLEDLAASLLQPAGPNEQSLVSLRTGGSAAPLFCIHGLGGHVAGFLPLARALAQEQPVFGLQAQGLGPKQQPHDCIQAMADFYVQEIRAVQPRGPYLLAGWSMGGLIALEAAQRLTAAGEDVPLVALLDTYLSADDFAAQDLDEHSVIRWLAPHLDLSLSELKKLPLDQQWERIAEQAKLSEAIGATEIRRMADVCRAHLAACARYVPQPYTGHVVLFQAEDHDDFDPRFNTLCPRLKVEAVPGNHYSMLRPPHVQILAQRLDHYLNEATQAGVGGNP